MYLWDSTSIVLPGQGSTSHCSVIVEFPVHDSPPYAASVIICRDIVLNELPQVELHLVAVHLPHWQLTKIKFKNSIGNHVHVENVACIKNYLLL